MAERTLSDLNIELEAVNKTLDEQTVGQGRLIDAVEDLVALQRRNLDDLEADIEDKDAAQPTAQPRGAGGGGTGGESFASGVLSKVPRLAGIPGAAVSAVPKLLAITMADEIGEYVTSQTGSEEVGSAVERGLVAGGIGSFFGKRIGLIAGIIGAGLTEENQDKLTKLGETLAPTFDKLKNAVTELVDVQLPTSEQVLDGVSNTFGNAIDGLTQLATGDFKGLTQNLDDIALSAAGLFALIKPGKSLSLAFSALKAPFKAASTALTSMAGLGAATTATTAAATGLTPGTVNKATGNIVGVDGKDTVVKGTDPKAKDLMKEIKGKAKASTPKVPATGKLAKFLKVLKAGGPLAAILSAAQIGLILSSDASEDEKIGLLGGAIGSGLAGLGGAALGTMLGAVGGPFGAVAGGLGFGLIGGFAGESIGMAIAQYLFDKKITAFGDGFLGKLINKAVGSPDAEAPTSIPTSSSGVDGGLAAAAAGGGMSTPPRTTGASVAQSVTAMSPGAMGGSAPSVVNAPTTMAIGSSQTTYAGGGVSTTDPRRPLFTGGTSY
jgi:hypothetical protein